MSNKENAVRGRNRRPGLIDSKEDNGLPTPVDCIEEFPLWYTIESVALNMILTESDLEDI